MKKLLCVVPLLVALLPSAAIFAADVAEETAAVRDVMKAYVAAFNAADAPALSSLWAEDGEYVDKNSDEPAKGLEAIEQTFVAYFEHSPDARLRMKDTSSEFSVNVAIVKGEATLVVVPNAEPVVRKYSATFVRQNDGWLLDQMVIHKTSRLSTAAIFQMIAEVIGGLGLFLLGMKNMSDGMQAVAGTSLRRLVGVVTNNRLMAAGVGTLVTAVVQSSSVTTVMVIGFVNSGVMQLSQGVGVIMGANIGTTMTAWLLTLGVGKQGLPILGVAAFVYLFSKGDRWRYWAMAIMGVGMVFFGLELMKDACALIKDMPAFEAWFHRFDTSNRVGVLMCAFAGCVLTMIVQSSSATLGITMALAAQGVIPFETAAALVLGENIGTTITAYLASLGATTNARRAAYFHVIFNLVGVFWVMLIFHWYIDLIRAIVNLDMTEAVVKNGLTTYPNTKTGIATTHTVFNVVNTLLFLPFMPLMVKLLERIVPAKAYKEKPRLTDLDVRMLETPLVAIEQSRLEIIKMGEGCRKMLVWQKTLFEQDEPDRELVDKLNRRERVLDTVHDEVTAYVTGLLSGNVPHTVAEEARRQLRMADEYESVSDYIADLLKFDTKLRADGNRFTEKHRSELVELNDLVAAYVVAVNEGNVQQNLNTHGETETARKHIGGEIKRLRHGLLDDLSDQAIPPRVSVAYMAALNAFARVRDHTHNIAESVSGEK